MPALADITINDGAATPVAKTFSPVMIDGNGVAEYADVSSGVAIGFPTIKISSRRTTENVRVKANISVPVLEALGTADSGLTPPPTVAYVARGHMEFILPLRSDLATREHVLAFVQNLSADAVVSALVEDLLNVH